MMETHERAGADGARALSCEVVVVGGGPAGSTTAIQLARRGVDVLLIEKAAFPRFQIGESLLPYNMELIEEMGLASRLSGVPHIPKRGAEFGMGGGLETTLFRFDQTLAGRGIGAFNIARADLDEMLLKAAREEGARVEQPASVRRVGHLEDGDVRLELDDGRAVQARYMVDATGQATLLGRHLKMRVTAAEAHLRKTAFFQHFTKVKRLAGELEGMPTIVMCEEGWFWIIPLNDTVTSVGIVLEPAAVKRVGVPANRMLQWGIARCPLMRDRMVEAQGSDVNMVRADFSYRCPPFAGRGFFMVGDAAMFLDPVFSTGVCLGMRQGREVGNHLANMLQGCVTPEDARALHRQAITGSTKWFSRLIGLYYDQSFRDLFLEGRGPAQMHKAVITVLAGHVFPEVAWKVRWRLMLFECCRWLQGHVTLAPRKPGFSLFGGLAEKTAKGGVVAVK